MGLFDSRLFSWIRPRQERVPPTPRQIRQLAGGRASIDKSDDVFGGFLTVEPPPDHESRWRVQDLDTKTLNKISPAELLNLLVDLSPEISGGLWNFLRLSNPGFELRVLRPGSEDVEHAQGKAALDEFINVLDDEYGSFDIVLNRLFLGAFMRGAFMAELVLDGNGREPVDLATPDPASARFRKVRDEVRGVRWQLGQWQGGQFVDLDRETVRYVPIDPLPGVPYGRPLVSPALFTALFLIGILHDLRRVVSQQGYPRIDIAVVTERLREIMPGDLESDPEKMREWVTGIVEEIQEVYSDLEPDDAYVHLDLAEVNRPVGTVDSQSLGAIDSLIRALERMAARGLKQMPLLLGIHDATTETNANRQWEIQIAGIKSLQHLAETMLERLFRLALQAQGIQAEVVFRFAEVRVAELLRDAQVEQLQIDNASKKYQAGWISQDEASEEITGHPADVPEPRAGIGGAAFPFSFDEPESNSALLEEIRAARQDVAGILNGHKEVA